jgi:hypothetical protein
MEEITNKKLVFDANEIKKIIKEYLLLKGIDVQIIDFYGTTLNYVNRNDYMGTPQFVLETVVCLTNQKEIMKKPNHEFIKITNPDVNKQIEVDLTPKDKRTWEDNMIYLINHSEVIDEPYFKSESGNPYKMGDKRINCLIKSYQSDKPIYRSGHIKLSEIGYRYRLVEDKYNDNDKIVIEEIWEK